MATLTCKVYSTHCSAERRWHHDLQAKSKMWVRPHSDFKDSSWDAGCPISKISIILPDLLTLCCDDEIANGLGPQIRAFTPPFFVSAKLRKMSQRSGENRLYVARSWTKRARVRTIPLQAINPPSSRFSGETCETYPGILVSQLSGC